MNGNKPHFWPGIVPINRTAIVLSCPGRLEERKKRPVAGVTGSNLDKLLAILRSHHPDIFASGNRYDYLVTNSSDKVHYPVATGDTEPSEEEIVVAKNLMRLQSELAHCTVVLVLGDRAALAVRQAKFTGSIIHCGWHLSMRRLNTAIHEDLYRAPIIKGQGGNTAKRIAVVANSILSMLPSRYLYRGVSVEMHSAGKALVPKGSIATRVMLHDGTITYGDNATCGNSLRNAVITHQKDSIKYPDAFISFSFSFDVAKQYALNGGRRRCGIVYVIDRFFLEAHEVVEHIVTDHASNLTKPLDQEVLLCAADQGTLPLGIVVDYVPVTS
ncbi:hypothetical protein [Magnetospirillum fulvum]|uniref:Uncharacterized protein n=1 Tax=Magnetospirillum fulvum TaxID=1082 RepID=A0A1H6H494_MAGFU|nr:hypothetical protein [Magnetospirillum fulvum]SEH30521.1 hypothetical protein SAMN04244559_00922 [Magnetospirillum fulvum]